MRELIEHITKGSVIVVGLFYILGFVAETISVSRFGFGPSLGVVRLQYVVAGYWVAMPFAAWIALLGGLFLGLKQRQARHEMWPSTVVGGLVTGPGLFIFSMGLCTSDQLSVSELAVVCGCAVVFVLSLFSYSAKPEVPHSLLVAVSGVLIVGLLTVALMVQHFYRLVPVRLGGGKPARVTVEWNEPGRQSQEFCYVQETDTNLLVLDGSGSPLSVSKARVSVIHWTKRACDHLSPLVFQQ